MALSAEDKDYFDRHVATAVAAAMAQMRVAEGAGPAVAAAAVNHVAVKLPEFWVSDPDMWFFQAEAAFRGARITASRTKFDHVVTKLPEAVSVAVRDFLLQIDEDTVDPYGDLKTELVTTFGKTRWQQAFALINSPGLGDRRPSVLMKEMLALLPKGEKPETLFLALFLGRLPTSMRDHLAAANVTTAKEMAQHADLLWDARAGHQVAAVESQQVAAVGRGQSPVRDRWQQSPDRRRSPERREQRQGQRQRQQTPHAAGRGSGLCRLHKKFGAKAKYCNAPCSWSEN